MIESIKSIYQQILVDVDVDRSFVSRPPFDPTLAGDPNRCDPFRSSVRRSRAPRVDVCRRVARSRRPARPSTPCAPGGLVYES